MGESIMTEAIKETAEPKAVKKEVKAKPKVEFESIEGVIKNYRRGVRTVTTNQCIIYYDSMDKKQSAELLGKKVEWTTSSGKKMKGKITGLHGGKGAVRARFEKGLPGQAIGTKITIG
jgi:large subunit ribosomal protein L35Ae